MVITGYMIINRINRTSVKQARKNTKTLRTVPSGLALTEFSLMAKHDLEAISKPMMINHPKA